MPGRGLRTLVAGALVALAALATGCAAETADVADDREPVQATVEMGTVSSAIFAGERDDDGDALPGVVALRVGTGGTFELCTGALVAPNVVLTARHCVTKNATSSVSCDENGRSANGPHVLGDEDPLTIGVYTGASPAFGRKPVALARAIVAPQGEYLCDADIALVVLDRSLNVEPLPIRLDAPARVGETIRTVGYGQNDKEVPIGTRFRKTGVKVLAQGKGISESRTPLGAREFEVGKSICQGDSGGPGISEETGAVIGVVSRGGGCDDDFGHIYTTTKGFDAMFAQAFLIAGATPRLESTTALHAARSRAVPESAEPPAAEEPGAGSCAVSSATGRTTSRPAGSAAALAALAALGARVRRRRA